MVGNSKRLQTTNVKGHLRMRTITNLLIFNLSLADLINTIFNSTFSYVFMKNRCLSLLAISSQRPTDHHWFFKIMIIKSQSLSPVNFHFFSGIGSLASYSAAWAASWLISVLLLQFSQWLPLPWKGIFHSLYSSILSWESSSKQYHLRPCFQGMAKFF